MKFIDWSKLALDFQLDLEDQPIDDELNNNNAPQNDGGQINQPPSELQGEASREQLAWETARERFRVGTRVIAGRLLRPFAPRNDSSF